MNLQIPANPIAMSSEIDWQDIIPPGLPGTIPEGLEPDEIEDDEEDWEEEED